MTRQPTLLILGDSISLGISETSGNDAVSHVQTSYVRHLAHAFPHLNIVTEAGVHRTTRESLAGLPQLLDRHAPDVVLAMFGGNDGEPDWKRFVLSEGRVIRHRVPVDRYVANLEELIRLCRAAGALPALTTFSHADAQTRGTYIGHIATRDVWGFMERNGGQAEWDRRRSLYVDAVTELADRTGTPLLCYADALDAAPHARMFSQDGAHPNDAGHAAIAAALIPKLAPLLATLIATPLLEGVP